MLCISDRCYISLLFDGKEFPLDKSPLISFQATESLKMGLPGAVIKVSDPNKFFKQNITLYTGLLCYLRVGTSPHKLSEYWLSLFSYKEELVQGGLIYTLVLVLANTTYINSSTSKVFKGTSNDALQSIATACGLTYVGTVTNDAQSWAPSNMRYYKWAVSIAAKGYVDDTSYMRVGVTLDHKLLYKNLNDVQKAMSSEVPVFLFGEVGDGVKSYTVWGKTFSNKSGSSNYSGGLKMKTLPQPLTKEEEKKEESSQSSSSSDSSSASTASSSGGFDIAGDISGTVADITGKVEDAVGDVMDKVSDAVDDAKDAVSGAIDKVQDSIDSVVGSLDSTIETLKSSLKSVIGDPIEAVKLVRKTKFLGVSSRELESVIQSVVNVVPPDPGNNHPKADQAKHQNKRIGLLHNIRLDVAIMDVSTVNIMDLVYVKVVDSNSADGVVELNEEQSGYYIVEAKTRWISSSGHYVEKFSLIREGSNANPSGTAVLV